MRLLTSGYSHNGKYICILDGIPSGIKIDKNYINNQLKLRASAKGRSSRMNIESDQITFFSGLINEKTTGAPLCFGTDTVDNNRISFTQVRPNHADYPAAIKYGFSDLSLASERTSARETVNTVMAGSICALVLKQLGIDITSTVLSVGGQVQKNEIDKLLQKASKCGDTLGGVAELRVLNLPAGFGGYSQYDQKLDGILSAALMSLPSVKGVEIGLGFGFSSVLGSECQDVLTCKGRISNFSGGIDGGVSNGNEIILRFVVKPIPSLQVKTKTIDIVSKKEACTTVLRADTCAVFSASVIARFAVAISILNVILTSLGGDTIDELKSRFEQKKQNDFLFNCKDDKAL